MGQPDEPAQPLLHLREHRMENGRTMGDRRGGKSPRHLLVHGYGAGEKRDPRRTAVDHESTSAARRFAAGARSSQRTNIARYGASGVPIGGPNVTKPRWR